MLFHQNAGDKEIKKMSYQAENLRFTVFWAGENDAIENFKYYH